MKKVKAQKKVEKKTIKELMKARRPLLLNMELIAAVNKIFWKNAHLSIFEICEMLREAGFAANATFYLDGREFQELVGNLHRNAEAVRAEVFNYPESIRGKRGGRRSNQGVRARETERAHLFLADARTGILRRRQLWYVADDISQTTHELVCSRHHQLRLSELMP